MDKYADPICPFCLSENTDTSGNQGIITDDEGTWSEDVWKCRDCEYRWEAATLMDPENYPEQDGD